MLEVNNKELGYFITYDIWKDAVTLLQKQLELKRKGEVKIYNKLSYFYFDLCRKQGVLNKVKTKKFFINYISNNLFYSLNDDFFSIDYPIHQKKLSLRVYTFFSLPLILVYYAIGLYLLRLTESYLIYAGYLKNIEKKKKFYDQLEDDKKINIFSFYGGNIYYEKDELLTNYTFTLKLDKNKLYYWYYYELFTKLIIKEANKKVNFVKLDIKDFFNQIDINNLLNYIDDYVEKPLKTKMNFDIHTKEQIKFFFSFLRADKNGIPQSDVNIISSFLSFLYLTFGDKIISEKYNYLNKKYKSCQSLKIFRYVDDYYLSFNFKKELKENIEKEKFIYEFYDLISDEFYNKLNLKFNYNKFDLFLLPKEKKKLKNSFFDTSVIDFLPDKRSQEKEKKKDNTDKIAEEYTDEEIIEYYKKKKISHSWINFLSKELKGGLKDVNLKMSLVFLSEVELLVENFKKSYNKTLEDLNYKHLNFYYYTHKQLKKYNNELKNIVKNFDISLIKLYPKVFISLLKYVDEQNNKNLYKAKIIDYIENSEKISTSLCYTIIEFLSIYGFKGSNFIKLKKYLKLNPFYKKIIERFENCKLTLKFSSIIEIEKIKDVLDFFLIEQSKLKVYNENKQNFSLALNHLVNEFHRLIYKYYKKSGGEKEIKEYTSEDVISFLKNKITIHNTKLIKNIFERRNTNLISHSANSFDYAEAISKEEYYKIKNDLRIIYTEFFNNFI